MEEHLKKILQANNILNKKTSLRQNAKFFITYNSNNQNLDSADTFTSYNWTIGKDGNIVPYNMISFSMPKESLTGLDPLNPEHDELRNAVEKIKKVFNL